MESIYVHLGTEVIQAVQLFRNPGLDHLFSWLTHLGEAPYIFAAIVCVSLFKGYRWTALAMLVAFLTADYLNGQLKELFDVPRPDSEHVYTANQVDSSSLPSAHTMGAAAAWFVLAVSLPNGWARAYVAMIPLVVGFTRVYLGMHYPGDVMLGLVLGGLTAMTVVTALKGVEELLKRPAEDGDAASSKGMYWPTFQLSPAAVAPF
jgi:membrane-associated phospholipid phosphatase